MVEMHLLSVNVDFRYDPIYALGIVSSFNQFMEGYKPPEDRVSIFNSLCKALEDDPQRYRQDADRLSELARSAGKALVEGMSKLDNWEGTQWLGETLQAIASNPNFKYSRLFAIGLVNLLTIADPKLTKDSSQQDQLVKKIGDALKLSQEKLQKDLELYRSNLEKLSQARKVMEDVLESDRKKQQQRLKEKGTNTNSQDNPTPMDSKSSSLN